MNLPDIKKAALRDALIALWLIVGIILLGIALCGCQSPRTSYMNGLVLWCSSSALGIGYGQYAEVAAGGKMNYSSSSSAPSFWDEGYATNATSFSIDNTNATNVIEKIGE